MFFLLYFFLEVGFVLPNDATRWNDHFRTERRTVVPPPLLQVDGGVTVRTAALAAAAGANEAVAGSAVFGAKDLRKSIRRGLDGRLAGAGAGAGEIWRKGWKRSGKMDVLKQLRRSGRCCIALFFGGGIHFGFPSETERNWMQVQT